MYGVEVCKTFPPGYCGIIHFSVLRTSYLLYIPVLSLQVCWIMLAITVAVRIDVYGVFYALILGLLLFFPRRFLAPVWFCYLTVHGLLLLVQYFLLLGVPYGACVGPGGDTGDWCMLVRGMLVRRELGYTQLEELAVPL